MERKCSGGETVTLHLTDRRTYVNCTTSPSVRLTYLLNIRCGYQYHLMAYLLPALYRSTIAMIHIVMLITTSMINHMMLSSYVNMVFSLSVSRGDDPVPPKRTLRYMLIKTRLFTKWEQTRGL
jgi:hypothetical protein